MNLDFNIIDICQNSFFLFVATIRRSVHSFCNFCIENWCHWNYVGFNHAVKRLIKRCTRMNPISSVRYAPRYWADIRVCFSGCTDHRDACPTVCYPAQAHYRSNMARGEKFSGSTWRSIDSNLRRTNCVRFHSQI